MLAVWALWRGCDRVHCEHSCPPASGDVCVLVATGTAGNWNCAGYHAECCSNLEKMGKTNKSPLGCKYLDYFQWPVSAGGSMEDVGLLPFSRSRVAVHAERKGLLPAPGAWGPGSATKGMLSAPLPGEPNAMWFIQGHGKTPQFGPWLFFCLSVTSGALL